MKYAILDIEASGGKKGSEKIIDIAIYQFDGEKVTDQFGSMVNPEKGIDKYVQKLTNITDKMVRQAPKFYQLAKRVVEITKDCIIVGHGVSFDYRMLRQEFNALGFDFQRDTLDTLTLAQKLLENEESYSLGKLCKSLGIPVNNRHRAQGDTLATLELFKLLLQKDSDKNILQQYAQVDPNNQAHVQKLLQLQRDLPEKAGVYYYHDTSGKVFYANACRNIAIGVNSDLASDKVQKQKVQNNVSRISYELTGSILLALLKLWNEKYTYKYFISRSLKDLCFKYGLYLVEDENKRKHLSVQNVKETRKAPLLLFSSKRKAYKEKENLIQKFGLKIEDNIAENHQKIRGLRKSLTFKEKSFLIVDKGRTKQEKSFVLIEDKKVKGYGFYIYYKQFEDEEVRNRLMVPVKNTMQAKALVNTFLYHKMVKVILLNKEKNKINGE